MFDLSYTFIECDASTTVDDLSTGVLIEGEKGQSRIDSEAERSSQLDQVIAHSTPSQSRFALLIASSL